MPRISILIRYRGHNSGARFSSVAAGDGDESEHPFNNVNILPKRKTELTAVFFFFFCQLWETCCRFLEEGFAGSKPLKKIHAARAFAIWQFKIEKFIYRYWEYLNSHWNTLQYSRRRCREVVGHSFCTLSKFTVKLIVLSYARVAKLGSLSTCVYVCVCVCVCVVMRLT